MQNIQIKTLTPTYDKVEDRIRFSINYQDIDNRIDLMITRSLIIQLLPILEEYIYKYYPNLTIQDEIVQIKVNDEVVNDDNTSSTNMEDILLYKSLEDLLVTINLKYDATNQYTQLEFISKDNHKASTICDANMLQSIIKSLKSSIPHFSWGIATHF